MSNFPSGQLCLARKAVEFIREQFRDWPLKALAKFLDVPPETLKNWFDGTSKPSTDYISQLFTRLGPRFIAFCTSPFEDTHLDLKAARIEAQIKALEAELEAAQKNRQVVRPAQSRPSRAVDGVLAIGRGSNDENMK